MKQKHFTFSRHWCIVCCTVLLFSITGSCEKGDTGPEGPQGIQSEHGATGGKGDKGAKGDRGATGAKGDKGDRGATGAKGDKGDQGARGATGPQGQQGERGAAGPRGATGPQGEDGATGPRGATGAQGPQGERGATGPRGATGAQGPQGERGATGPAGPRGAPGTANVVSSGWIDYQINSTPNTSTVKTMEYTFPANALSLIGAADISTFLSNGGILILYGKNYGNTQHKMLPYNHSDVDYTWMSTGLGGANSILIRIASSDGSVLTDYDYADYRGNEFRYVLIPAGVRINGVSNAGDIDWSRIGYAEAKQMLGLRD